MEILNLFNSAVTDKSFKSYSTKDIYKMRYIALTFGKFRTYYKKKLKSLEFITKKLKGR